MGKTSSAPKSRFSVSGRFLEPSRARALSFKTPPRSSPKRLWSSQGHPKFPQERPEAPKGHIKSTKLACLKPWKSVYLASRNLKKTFPDNFFTLRGSLGDLPEWRPRSSKALLGAKKALLERPGTSQRSPRRSQGPPRPPL